MVLLTALVRRAVVVQHGVRLIFRHVRDRYSLPCDREADLELPPAYVRLPLSIRRIAQSSHVKSHMGAPLGSSAAGE